MQAIILAAGMGKRLKALTHDNTKCMIKVNGITLIERMLMQLDSLHLSRIVIVVGYKGRKLIDYIHTLNVETPVIFVENPVYYKTNNIYSLFLASNYLAEDDTLLLESDIICEDSVLKDLACDKRKTLALVDRYESWMDGTVVTIDKKGKIERFISKKDFNYGNIKNYYKTVNIYKFGKKFANEYYIPFLKAYLKSMGSNEYYEQVLQVLTLLNGPKIEAKKLNGQSWYEIDDIQDLDIAESIFTPEDERLFKIQKRYGGYWRYPKLKDFCYLVNPYFPSQKLMDEIKASFERLVCNYPSGMEVNCLLAAKYYSLNPENMVVGNGASEIIKSIMSLLPGRIGVILPTFEEYRNRRKKEDVTAYIPKELGYRYTAEDLIEFFDGKPISGLIIINPDNPSGNYMCRDDIDKLILWAEKKDIFLIDDESFADFADVPLRATLLQQDELEKHPNVIVVKSLSKSFGIPGLRLGIAASGNQKLIKSIKNDVSIWNINSFAEFYMQIVEKYKSEYNAGLKSFCKVRARFVGQLKNLPNIRVFPSQANFIMCEILNGRSSTETAKILLENFNILIKDLSAKCPFNGAPYIRVAIKTPAENDMLVSALKKTLQ
ncbi:MAG TPA: aminotransferase [Ruminococcaceae bacterium]|jgi:histidinol-phosphate/aromatic aminotransferase/cobyric acid decarboxylase-like protein/choline kinase|nr:aminotransferase [Oscillospiraceae bacterium]